MRRGARHRHGERALVARLVAGIIAGGLAVAGCPGARTARDAGACPLAGESAEDCPWAAIGRASARDPDSLQETAPDLLVSIDDDAQRPELLALWAESSNFDEIAHAEIVPPAVLDVLLRHAHVAPSEGNRTHAGIEHTYGYLLSTIKTPFGWKRARWVKPDLELAFSLTKGALGPRPPGGTLLSNVTYLAGRIAFRSDAGARKTVEAAMGVVDPSLVRVAYAQLAITRLTEALMISGRTVLLRTDFVPFPRAVTGGLNSHLLVYSIADSNAPGPRLVTAFPVTTAFVQKALDPSELGEALPITTRYNAYVEGVTGQSSPLRGRRGADGAAPP